MKYLISGLTVILVSFLLAGNFYWHKAYEEKPVIQGKTVYVGTGALRWNASSNFHVLIGYDAENCQIITPPEQNVVANGYFEGTQYYKAEALITIGGKPHSDKVMH